MKKIITTLVALTAITLSSFAQNRELNFNFGVVEPAENSVLPCNDSFAMGVLAINNGPDVAIPGDTLFYLLPNNEMNRIWYQVLDTTVNIGDTILSGSLNLHVNQIRTYAKNDSIRYTIETPITNGTIGLVFGIRVSNDDITPIPTPWVALDVTYNCATGINDFTKTQLGIYPNPAKNQITVNFDATAAAGTIRVLDVMGRTIITQNVAKNTSAYTLDISSLNNGSYFVELVSGDVRGINKFVVSK